MRQRNREAVDFTDPRDLLFGTDDDDLDVDERSAAGTWSAHGGSPLLYPDHPSGPHLIVREPGADVPAQAETRESGVERNRRARRRQRRRNRGFVVVLAVVLVLLIGAVGWFAGRPLWRYFHPSNYSGMGAGSVQVVVHPGDSAGQIGQTLLADGVVASVRAFTDAASSNANSVDIQPGTYLLHRHMSAQDALTLLLRPSSRISADVVVPEGATIVDVEQRLTAPRCTARSAPAATCGLGLPRAAVVHALDHVGSLGLPTDYTADGTTPPSAEGFLYPATYPFDGKTSAAGALGQMISRFTDEVRRTNFTASAKALGLTPYQELIVASIAQAEAKYAQDMPKVTRVILNRLAAHRPLQIDGTSAYAARLRGLDPTKQIYAETKGPYNTYTNAGLPPTPISNPGEAALNAAAHPAKGDWLYYVNGDSAGHLAFFASAARFEKAAQRCRARGWCQ